MSSLAEKLRQQGRVKPQKVQDTLPVAPTAPTVPLPPANADHAQMMELFSRRMNGGPSVAQPVIYTQQNPAEQMAYQMMQYQPTYEELHAQYLKQQRTPEQYLEQCQQAPHQVPPPPPVWQRPIPTFEYGASSIHDAFHDQTSMDAMLRLAATLHDPTVADMPKADRVPPPFSSHPSHF